MAAPVVESYTEQATEFELTSFDFAKPSGVTAGDVLLLIVGNDDSNSLVDSIDTPSGWTQRVQTGDGDSDVRLAFFTRTADGTEGSVQTVTMTGTQDHWAGFYLRISGADEDEIIVGTPTNSGSGSGSSADALSITTTANDTLVIAATAFDGADAAPITVSGTGWSGTLPSGQVSESGGGGSGLTSAWHQRDVATAGASNDLTWSYSATDGYTACQIAFGPAASGATVERTGSVAGTGTLTGSGVRAVDRSGSVAGTGALTGSGVADGSESANGSLSGAAVLSGAGYAVRSATGSVAGVGTLAGSGIRLLEASGVLAGSASLSAAGAGILIVEASGVLTGAGVLVGTPTKVSVRSGTIAGVGTLTGTVPPVAVAQDRNYIILTGLSRAQRRQALSLKKYVEGL